LDCRCDQIDAPAEGSVELDAVEPETLRGLVRACVEQHMDRRKLETLLVAEESERKQLAMFAHEAREL
jgi:hypothetical protein